MTYVRSFILGEEQTVANGVLKFFARQFEWQNLKLFSFAKFPNSFGKTYENLEKFENRRFVFLENRCIFFLTIASDLTTLSLH